MQATAASHIHRHCYHPPEYLATMKSSLIVVVCLLLLSKSAAASFAHNHRHLQESANITDALFRRYLVNIRGTASNADQCPPPQPSITIKCASSQLQLVDVDDSTTCMSNVDTNTTTTMPPTNTTSILSCTGSGRVLVDCIQNSMDAEEFLEELSFLAVELLVPQTEFECNFRNPNAFVGQTVFIGIVCPGVSLDYTKIECTPNSTFLNPETSEPLCLERCTNITSCTQDDLMPLFAEVKDDDACYWDPSITASPSVSLAPSNAPSVSMAPSVSSMPSISAAPTDTLSMSPSIMETTVETTNAPTSVLGGGSSTTTSSGTRLEISSILMTTGGAVALVAMLGDVYF